MYTNANGERIYPFSTCRNQRYFSDISVMCMMRMREMDGGKVPFDADEYARLKALRERANYFYGLELPTAWLTGPECGEAKGLVEMALRNRASRRANGIGMPNRI